jgi:hypothetical protein
MWGILRYSSWRMGYISLGSVSYFISSWLFFGDQNIVNRIYLCSRISRRIVQQLHEYGNKDRPDSHMDRSDVMQFKSSSTKTQVPRSLAVRCLSERKDGPSGRAAVPVLNPECPVRSPSGRFRTRRTKGLEKAMLP